MIPFYMGLKKVFSDELNEYGWIVDEYSTGVGTVEASLINERNENTIEIEYSDWKRLIGGSAKATITINESDERTVKGNAKEEIKNVLEDFGV